MPKARAELAAKGVAITLTSVASATGMATLSPWWAVDLAEEVIEAALPRLQ